MQIFGLLSVPLLPKASRLKVCTNWIVMQNSLSVEGLYINDFHRENSMAAQRAVKQIRLAVGSSRMIIDGFLMNIRAMATRCCWPPLSRRALLSNPLGSCITSPTWSRSQRVSHWWSGVQLADGRADIGKEHHVVHNLTNGHAGIVDKYEVGRQDDDEHGAYLFQES